MQIIFFPLSNFIKEGGLFISIKHEIKHQQRHYLYHEYANYPVQMSVKTNLNVSNVCYHFSFGSGILNGYMTCVDNQWIQNGTHINVKMLESKDKSECLLNCGVTSLVFIKFLWKVANGMLNTSLISLEKYRSRTCVTCINSKQEWRWKSGAKRIGKLSRSILIFSKLTWHDYVHLNGTLGLRRSVKGEAITDFFCLFRKIPVIFPRINAVHGA